VSQSNHLVIVKVSVALLLINIFSLFTTALVSSQEVSYCTKVAIKLFEGNLSHCPACTCKEVVLALIQTNSVEKALSFILYF
jgi:hypothetical protein